MERLYKYKSWSTVEVFVVVSDSDETQIDSDQRGMNSEQEVKSDERDTLDSGQRY